MNSLHFYTVNSDGKPGLINRALNALLLVTGLLMSFSLTAAELTAEVDRTTVIDGESVVLYLEGTDIPQLPDTSALNANFRIMQSGQSSSQTIINGRSSRKVTVRFELQPKNLGSSVIPAFTVAGVSSQPITIEVVARGTPGVEPRDKVFAELSVDNPEPYVQEQVILSLKIFDDGNLVSADPALTGNSDYQIEQLGLGREQIVERNGVQYRVNTFRYALFPQQSGNITIDEITIPASLRDNSYAGNLILFNTPTRRIELKSDAISLTVKPRAAASTSGWWLPVKSLELKHEWSADIRNAKTGEPLTLTLEMVASGSTATQLPEISIPDVPGVKIYGDNPEFGSQPAKDNLLGVRREKWSVIPNQSGPDTAGQLLLPEIVVKWWDTQADIERRAVIPAQQIKTRGNGTDASVVSTPVPDTGNDSATPAAAQTDLSPRTEVAEQQSVEPTDAQQPVPSNLTVQEVNLSFVNTDATELVPRHWLWLAVVAATAWLATLFAWWWSVRRRNSGEVQSEQPPHQGSERRAFKRMQSVARSGDASVYSEAVLEWAQCRWPDNQVHNLPEIGNRLGHRPLTDAMRLLDRRRFSGHQDANPSVSLTDIQTAFEDALRHETTNNTIQDQHALPPL